LQNELYFLAIQQLSIVNSRDKTERLAYLFAGRPVSLPAGPSVCHERNKTAGKNQARRADELPAKEKQPGKSFASRVIAGR
jgi:hypothetical protein